MTDRDALGRWLSLTLSAGTLLAVVIVAAGLLAGAAGGGTHAAGAPLGEVIAGGDAASIVAIGLLVLAVVPLAELMVAASAFARASERRYLVVSVAVLIMLMAGLGAALVGPAGG